MRLLTAGSLVRVQLEAPECHRQAIRNSFFSPDQKYVEWLVFITLRFHLFPFRTQKLSSAVPTILGGRPPGKIGLCQHEKARSFLRAFSFTFSTDFHIGGQTQEDAEIFGRLLQLTFPAVKNGR